MINEKGSGDLRATMAAIEAEKINMLRRRQLYSLYEIPDDEIIENQFQEVTLLPQNRRFFIPYPYKGLINPHVREEHTVDHRGVTGDVIGAPFTGKSEGAEEALAMIPNLILFDEHSTENLTEEEQIIIKLAENWPIEIRNFVLSYFRIKNSVIELGSSIQEDVQFLRDEGHQYPNKLFMRGVNDLFSLGYFLNRQFQELLVSQIYSFDITDLKETNRLMNLMAANEISLDFTTYLRNGFDFLDQVDFVALYYFKDINVAKKRRIAAGLSPEGRFVNDRYWPTMDLAYKWWIYYMYPFLRENYGTGLIVIDGNQDRDRNKRRLQEYISAVIEQKDTLRRGTDRWHSRDPIYDLVSHSNRKGWV